MLSHSAVNVTSFRSVLGENSIIGPSELKHRKELPGDLLLTALIDAFSILVIFLLMSFSSTGELLFLGKDTELPKAAQSDMLERNPVVKFENERIYLEDKEVQPNELVQGLLDLRKVHDETRPGEEFPGVITIQADRRVKFEMLNSAVLASAQAGFSDIKFAVIAK
jgi:biopolymer transport protein ExbD